MNSSCKTEDIASRICHLSLSKHLDIRSVAIEEQRVAPSLLTVRHDMNIVPEKEHLIIPVIPSAVCRQHILILPGVGIEAEGRKILRRVICQGVSLDKYRVCEHVHLILECELLQFGIICSIHTLDYLSILVTHRTTLAEHCHRVLGVIVKMTGTERIVILVSQLDYRTSELSQVGIYQISELVTLENGLLLKDAHMSPRLDHTGVDIPKSRITKKVCIIMKETRRSDNLSVTVALDVNHLGRLRTQQHDKAVLLLVFLSLEGQSRQQCHQHEYVSEDIAHLLFSEFLSPTFTFE